MEIDEPIYSALWIRCAWLVIIGALAAALILLLGRKLKTWKKVIALVMAFALIILGGGSAFKALLYPKIETIAGCYDSDFRQSSLSPFETTYVFVCGDEKYFLESDPFSKRKIFDRAFIKGKAYTVSYEKNTNLIVAVSQND